MLSYDKAHSYYGIIMESEQSVLRREFFFKALEYAHIRALCQLYTREQRYEMDQRRTLAHNAFIDASNILSRNMAKNDENISWREDLGDDRKILGDFACYLHCFLGIEAR